MNGLDLISLVLRERVAFFWALFPVVPYPLIRELFLFVLGEEDEFCFGRWEGLFSPSFQFRCFSFFGIRGFFLLRVKGTFIAFLFSSFPSLWSLVHDAFSFFFVE